MHISVSIQSFVNPIKTDLTVCIGSMNSFLLKPFQSPVFSVKRWSIDLKRCAAADPVQRWSSYEEGPTFLKTLNPLQTKCGYGFIHAEAVKYFC